MVFTYPDFSPSNIKTLAVNPYESPNNTLRFGYISVINQPVMEKWWSCKTPNDFSTCSGMMAYTIRFFAEYLNMTAKHVVGRNGELGRRLPNGSWTGATLDIIENKADVSIVGWQPSRCTETTCLDFLAEIRYATLTPMPKRKLFIQGFIQPFTPGVWIALLVSFVAMGLILWALKDKYYHMFNWMKFFGTVLGNDIPQDTGFGEKVSQFFPLSTWYIGMAFISFSYTALIIGYFTDPFEPKAKNLRMILDTGHKLLVSPNTNILIPNLKASSNPIGKTYAGKMQEVRPIQDDNWYFPQMDETYTNDLILVWLRLESGETAGLERWTRFYVVDTNRLYPVPVGHRTIIFRKTFPRMKEVWKIWYHYFEHGFQAWNEKSTYKRIIERMREQSRYVTSEDELKPIAMSHIYGIFILWGIGVGLGFFAFMWEMRPFKKATTNNKQPTAAGAGLDNEEHC